MKSEQSMSARAAARLAPNQLAGEPCWTPSDQAPGPYFYGGDAAGCGGYGWVTGQERALFSGTDCLPGVTAKSLDRINPPDTVTDGFLLAGAVR
jgi:hypothetical protein